MSWSRPDGPAVSCARHRVQQPRRDDQPAEPQGRDQALARRAGVDDVIGCERLQRAHRLPVVPELPVVVVLDHHPAPARRVPAALRMQGHAQRELVCRGQQRGIGPVGRADHGAAAVDRQRPQAQALALREVAVGPVAVGLDGERGRAGRAQRGAGDRQAVREARADDDVAGIGGHAPGPGQVPGQHRPQLRESAPIRVVQQRAGRGRQHLAGGRQPRAAREGGQVGDARAQVVAGRAGLGAGQQAGAGLGGGTFGDRGPRAGPGGEPALRDQLAVHLGHRVAGQAQIGGQGPRGRQPGAGTEAPGPDGVAERRLQAEADALRALGSGQVQVQVDAAMAGPLAIFGPCF